MSSQQAFAGFIDVVVVTMVQLVIWGYKSFHEHETKASFHLQLDTYLKYVLFFLVSHVLIKLYDPTLGRVLLSSGIYNAATVLHSTLLQ